MEIKRCGSVIRFGGEVMEIEEVLAKATPRPWDSANMTVTVGICVHGSPHNDALAVLAVNAYEQNQATIRALTEALKRLHDPDGCGDHCRNSCAHCQAATALALANGGE